MQRLYDRGEESLEKEMDIIRIIKDLRNLKIFIKSKLLDEDTSNMIKLSGLNIIPIDSSSEEEESSP